MQITIYLFNFFSCVSFNTTNVSSCLFKDIVAKKDHKVAKLANYN